ncbi:MAG: hypothetical protein Q7S33_00870 [Nanoarchaeota archaeon]|nr:hypothetical protein [Nanoarchaeota archaeon]
MASLTLSVSDEFKNKLKSFLWVNWSEIAREETMKKLIFENYVKTGIITDEEWEFCDKMNWHPVDELPLKDDFKKELEKRKKEKSIKLKSVSQIFKDIK